MENKLYRTEFQKDLFLIGFSYDNIPVAYSNINEWLAAITLFPEYIFEPPNETIQTYNDIEYQYFLTNFSKVDYIILEKKFTSLVPKDNTELLRKYCMANEIIVGQYLSGSEKVINQLMGIILRENKGLNPKSLKSELEIFINKEYKHG